MLSRRTALQLGGIVGAFGIAGLAAQRAGVLDDGLRAAGLRPHARPDPRDITLLTEAATEQAQLLAALDTLDQDRSEMATIRAVLREQLAAVSDGISATPGSRTPATGTGTTDLTAFADRVDAAATARTDGALSAGSLAVVKVLAAMSAGLEQVAVVARSRA